MSREDRQRRKEEQRDKQHQRQAKLRTEPAPSKSPKVLEAPDFEQTKVQWCFELFDHQMDWRRNKGNDDHCGFCEVAGHMHTYSGRTWTEIRVARDRDHASAVGSLSKAAQDRLRELNLDDVDELWRFRFTATQRLWGIKEGQLLKVIWWDPDHQVYPTEPRNT